MNMEYINIYNIWNFLIKLYIYSYIYENFYILLNLYQFKNNSNLCFTQMYIRLAAVLLTDLPHFLI